MNSNKLRPTSRLIKFIQTNSYLFTSIVGVVVIFGWIFNISSLVQVHSSFAPMQFNTALCFLLISVPFIFKKNSHTIVLVITCLLITTLTGLQYILSINLGIDELFIQSSILVKTSHPGRMSPLTLLCFLLTGVYYLLLFKRKSKYFDTLLRCTILTLLFAILSMNFIRYLLQFNDTYQSQFYSEMAIHTSACFLFLCFHLYNSAVSGHKLEVRKRIYRSIIIGASIYSAVVIFALQIGQSEQETINSFLSTNSNSIVRRFQLSLTSQVEAFKRMASRASVNSYPTEESFRADAKNYLSYLSNIQAIEKISNKDKIIWLEPIENNEAILNKKLNQDKKRHVSLTKAIQTKKPQFSSIIQLIQGGDGILLFNPIFRNNIFDSYLVTVFKVDNLFNTALGDTAVQNYQITINSKEHQIILPKNDLLRNDLAQKRSLEINGLNVEFTFIPTVGFIKSFKTTYPELTLFLGLLAAILIGLMTYLVQTLKFKNNEVFEAFEFKSMFLANVSHEIRTPLNGVIGIASLLEENLESKENQQRIDLIKASSQSLLHLVNDILDFSKIESNSVKLDIAEFNFIKLGSVLSKLYGPLAETKGIDLVIDFKAAQSYQYHGDSTRITQVLGNLISNAIKFTPSGEVKIVIHKDKSDQKSADRLNIQVSDTGIGISSDNIKKLFKTYSQADASTTRNYGGTGLGLSISKSYVELMGGTILCESILDKGSTFTVSLDLPRASELKNEKINESINKSRPPLVQIPLNVLIAEDNPINVIVIKGLLEKLGCHVEVANNGQRALDMASAKTYDVIFMDCQMPILDGFEATRRIISQLGELRPYIVALTASSTDSDKEKCNDAGMDEFLSKPIHQENLIKVLQTVAALKERAA